MAHVISPLVLLPVHDSSGAAEARRVARTMALHVGLSEEDAGRAAIVATEAATNLVKHAQGGEMILRVAGHENGRVVDLLAIDRGPGMANLAECLRDGYTTVGTAGNGLGAIARQSSVFDAYSKPGSGTVVFSRIAAGASARTIPSESPGMLLVDGLSLQKKGEDVSGDNWSCIVRGGVATVVVADGLGHGVTAADAAREAIAAFHEGSSLAPLEVLSRVHRALMKTRGAAVSVAHIDGGRGLITYAGIGNIAATVEDGAAPRHLVSLHGIAGHQVRRLQDFSYPWKSADVLVMHSDGVSAHWSLSNYPGLVQRHALVIAAVLLRDFSRGRDDATVVVAKHAGLTVSGAMPEGEASAGATRRT